MEAAKAPCLGSPRAARTAARPGSGPGVEAAAGYQSIILRMSAVAAAPMCSLYLRVNFSAACRPQSRR